MRPSTDPTIRLSEYLPPAYWVDTVDLVFVLAPESTRVRSKIAFRPAAERAGEGPHDLWLDGRDIKLIEARINGTVLSPDILVMEAEGLRVPAAHVPEGGFIWEAEVEINPAGNTALEGLYMSNGMYCTQCEAQGFRKITYYPDRPDVMAVFTVTIEGDAPILLSNGNKLGHGQWHDPHPKPAYLFALVAGDLVAVEDRFTTMSGRDVALEIWVRDGDQEKCAYAMDALKRSMRWDEEVYGREYDLDLFMIVAVDDFNMGAMENKGLNIFNSKYVLASPETATDRDYELIEGIIAHEYFHNWTGNRITCRDWFQLCLKEGLTVFRDQQFSGDMRSHAVKRIDDVLMLRARQFREDAGPLAHPVRPEEYIEINNFYTATVYEKGAEVIGMLKLLVGDDGYKTALDLYFERHDGQACTIEDWIKVFEDACGRDLTQFKLWYSQSGTPRVQVDEDFKGGTYRLTLSQTNPPTPGQAEKAPQVIPVRMGLLDSKGTELSSCVLELTGARQEFEFKGLSDKPTPSLLRGFSAPVILERDTSKAERAFLLAHDTDPFNRWEAGRALAKDILVGMITNGGDVDAALIDGLGAVARDTSLDPAFRSLVLTLPGEDDLAQTLYEAGHVPDPAVIHDMRNSARQQIAGALEPDLAALYDTMRIEGPYTPDAKAAGRRALRASALSYLSLLDGGTRAAALFAEADNMTESIGALGLLIAGGNGIEQTDAFYARWKEDRLVIDKWFALQIMRAKPDSAVAVTKALTGHSDFDWKNPNRFRSVFGALSQNAAGFHDPSGAGYALFADWMIKLDALNPQTTARMCGAFETWKRYDDGRQNLIRSEMERIAGKNGLSKDTSEIIGKILAA